jgi:NAD(P)-dependent dehydrogenase (short-subunit alcohol dehydrogenase family)
MTAIPIPPPVSLTSTIRQSPPVDLSLPYSLTPLSNKHILITGGASGFGAAFVSAWAAAGASIVVADIDEKKGTKAVDEVRTKTSNPHIHFVRCDVRNWKDQVKLFRAAVELSPHGGIDIVVANAGVAGPEPVGDVLSGMTDLSSETIPKPDFRVLDVNIYGLMYTAHLALLYLPRNPGSQPSDPGSKPSSHARDRHLLLIGSMASIAPIPTNPLYGASKHAVLGAFRALRASAFVQGVRVNMLCPYFIETAIMTAPARVILAGGGMGKVEDVVDAASRLCAESGICGRALCVGPRVRVRRDGDGEWVVVVNKEDGTNGDGEGEVQERAVWEAYADDFEDCELFTRRIVGVLKGAEAIKGWVGWVKDLVAAIRYGIFG